MHFSIQHAENGKITRVRLELGNRTPATIDHSNPEIYLTLSEDNIKVFKDNTLVGQLPIPARAGETSVVLKHHELGTIRSLQKRYLINNLAHFRECIYGRDEAFNEWCSLKLQSDEFKNKPDTFTDAIVWVKQDGTKVRPGAGMVWDDDEQKRMWEEGRVTGRFNARQLPSTLGPYKQTTVTPNTGKLPEEAR